MMMVLVVESSVFFWFYAIVEPTLEPTLESTLKLQGLGCLVT